MQENKNKHLENKNNKPFLSFRMRKVIIHAVMLSVIAGTISISNYENILNIDSYRSFFAHLFIWSVIIFFAWVWWKIILSFNTTRDLYKNGLIVDGVIMSARLRLTGQFGPEPLVIKYKYCVGDKEFISECESSESMPEKLNFKIKEGLKVKVLYKKNHPDISTIFIPEATNSFN